MALFCCTNVALLAPTDDVPRIVHHVWDGRTDSDASRSAVLAWRGWCEAHGVRHRLWTPEQLVPRLLHTEQAALWRLASARHAVDAPLLHLALLLQHGGAVIGGALQPAASLTPEALFRGCGAAPPYRQAQRVRLVRDAARSPHALARSAPVFDASQCFGAQQGNDSSLFLLFGTILQGYGRR